MAWYDDIANTTKSNVTALANALMHPVDTATNQVKQGVLYKNKDALAALLRGDTTPIMTKLNEKSPSNPMDALDAAMMLGTIKGVGKIPLTAFEKAHLTAQQNAALPVSKGGLGLHPENTAMERAKALGFDSNVYHGTPSPNIHAADYAHSGKGYDQYGASALYTTTEPHYASGFANPDIEGANVMPLKVRTAGFVPSDIEKELTSSQIQHLINNSPDEYALSNFGDVDYEGRNKVIRQAVNAYKDYGNGELLNQLNSISNDFYPNNPGEFNKHITDLTGIRGLTVDLGGNHKFQLPYDPKDIRSVNAAFDPFRRNEADILAGVGALPFIDYNKKK